MTYKEAKKLKNGSQITINKTRQKKTVIRTAIYDGKYGNKYVDILCDDYTLYYHTEVDKA